MKTLLLSLSVGFGQVLMAQISVPQTTKSFYGIVEATWCGACGQYGIPSTNTIISQTDPKAVYVALHKSTDSQLYAETAAHLATAFNTYGQPNYTLNGINLGAHTSTMVTDVTNAIENFYTTSGATVNAGFEYGIVGDSLYVHTRTEFFQQLNGEYYMGIYVYEDSIWEWQANYDPGIPDMDIWHNHVLRTSLNGFFGQEIATGTTSAGTSILRNAKIALNPGWNPDQLHVFTVIWKKNGTTFEFVNANDAGAVISGQAGMEENEAGVFTVYPNPTSRLITLAGLQATEETRITLYDLNGNVALTAAGASELDLVNLANGQYIVQVIHNGKCYQHRIIKNQ